MMKVFYALFFIATSVCGFPNSVLKNDLASLKNGKALKELYEVIRSPDVLGNVGDPQKFAEAFLARAEEIPSKGQNCACCGYSCGCCVHMEIDKIKLNSTGCVNISYLPAPEYGVSASLTIDGYTIFNETVSARNPPPICAAVPHLKDLVSVCLKFYNITFKKNDSFSACLKLEAELVHFEKWDVKVGCFKIPLQDTVQGRQPCGGVPEYNKGRQPNFGPPQDSQSLKYRGSEGNIAPDIFVELYNN